MYDANQDKLHPHDLINMSIKEFGIAYLDRGRGRVLYYDMMFYDKLVFFRNLELPLRSFGTFRSRLITIAIDDKKLVQFFSSPFIL